MADGEKDILADITGLQAPPRLTGSSEENFRSLLYWNWRFFNAVVALFKDVIAPRLDALEAQKAEARLKRLEDAFADIDQIARLSGSTDAEREATINDILDEHDLPPLPEE